MQAGPLRVLLVTLDSVILLVSGFYICLQNQRKILVNLGVLYTLLISLLLEMTLLERD